MRSQSCTLWHAVVLDVTLELSSPVNSIRERSHCKDRSLCQWIVCLCMIVCLAPRRTWPEPKDEEERRCNSNSNRAWNFLQPDFGNKREQPADKKHASTGGFGAGEAFRRDYTGETRRRRRESRRGAAKSFQKVLTKKRAEVTTAIDVLSSTKGAWYAKVNMPTQKMPIVHKTR